MYKQSLVKIVQPIKKTTITRMNRGKKWKYGYNKEHDLIVLSHNGVIGEIIVHHNIFRRWYDVKGREKNSRSYWKEDKYLISEDQIFLYKRNGKWKAPQGYCFVQPIKERNSLETDKEESCIGIIKYSDGTFNKKELVGFRPKTECEEIINGERLYRVLNKFITIKYEYQGNEEEYNPSWAESC